MMAFMCFGNTDLLFRYKMIKTPLTFTELRCYKIKNKFDSNRFVLHLPGTELPFSSISKCVTKLIVS